MARSRVRARAPSVEAALGFALGAVGGCVLGATEDPVDRVIAVMTSAGPMKPVMDEVRTVGALGLGTLLGATALTTAMTSIVAGVILAAATASVFLATRSCGTLPADPIGLWTSAGLAGVLGTTMSGATLGVAIKWIVTNLGMVALLWALSVFTILKPPLHFLLKFIWQQGDTCCGQGPAALARQKEDREAEAREMQRRVQVAVQMEQRILALEKGGSTSRQEYRPTWEEERRKREMMERERMEREQAEMEERSIQDWINSAVVKYVDFLAFSGIPMTITAIVTTVFGVYGYGGHQSVFIALLALVTCFGFLLMKTSDLKFWMLAGFMAMLATFVVAVLTLHAGQEVVTASMKMRQAGKNQSRETISAQMNYRSSLEALNAGLFVAKLFQLALGATVGGPLVRWGAGEGRVIVGTAVLAGAVLTAVEVLSPVLGEGGKAGALLGAVGAAGVSVGAAAAVAGNWSSWVGTLGTIVGLAVGALVMGKWHFFNIGVQVPVAYIFAMTNPF